MFITRFDWTGCSQRPRDQNRNAGKPGRCARRLRRRVEAKDSINSLVLECNGTIRLFVVVGETHQPGSHDGRWVSPTLLAADDRQ